MNIEKKCPACAELIKSEARVCKHCGYQYTQAEMAEQRKATEEAEQTVATGCGIIVLAGLIYGIYSLSGCGEKNEQPQPVLGFSTEGTSAEKADYEEPPVAAPSATLNSLKRQEYGETIATAINLNGLLCAKVTRVQPLKVNDSTFEVTCIEYRGGSGTVRYIVNTDTGVAFKQ